MPKQRLVAVDSILEAQIIETLLAGLKEYRPDLNYPESTSDMQACVRGLLRMFEIKRLPIAMPLRYECDNCKGTRYIRSACTDGSGMISENTCTGCKGRGFTEG